MSHTEKPRKQARTTGASVAHPDRDQDIAGDATQALRYDGPTITTIGSVGALTHGGFYNDNDSPGVRKSK